MEFEDITAMIQSVDHFYIQGWGYKTLGRLQSSHNFTDPPVAPNFFSSFFSQYDSFLYVTIL